MFNRKSSYDTDYESQSSELTPDYASTLNLDSKKARKYADLSVEFAEHQQELRRLRERMNNLQNASRGGGIPWNLLILLGGAYLLYRSNDTVRTQVKGVVSRVMPGNEDTQTPSTTSMGTTSMGGTSGTSDTSTMGSSADMSNTSAMSGTSGIGSTPGMASSTGTGSTSNPTGAGSAPIKAKPNTTTGSTNNSSEKQH